MDAVSGSPVKKLSDSSDSIQVVRQFNRWRRGLEYEPYPNPSSVGHALDDVCDRLEKAERELGAKNGQET